MPRKYDKKVFNTKVFLEKFQESFLNDEQRRAYEVYKENDITFLIGEAGTGKTFLAIYFAIYEILTRQKEKIILSRPVVEAGENLGFLPGDMADKVYPYMLPLYDCLDKICGRDGDSRKYVDERYELAPLAFLRGRTLGDAVCVLDEAQNCTRTQLKMFLTRLGQNGKMIVTGDPAQTDLKPGQSGLAEVVEKLKDVPGIGYVHFTEEAIVRHPLVVEIVKRI